MINIGNFTIHKEHENSVKQITLLKHALEMAGYDVEIIIEEDSSEISITMYWSKKDDER